MVFPVRSTTEATIRHPENANIPTTEKPRQQRSKNKVMLVLFFLLKYIVHMEFIPEGASANKTRYKDILSRLRDSIRRSSPNFSRMKDRLLLLDNPPCMPKSGSV